MAAMMQQKAGVCKLHIANVVACMMQPVCWHIDCLVRCATLLDLFESDMV